MDKGRAERIEEAVAVAVKLGVSDEVARRAAKKAQETSEVAASLAASAERNAQVLEYLQANIGKPGVERYLEEITRLMSMLEWTMSDAWERLVREGK